MYSLILRWWRFGAEGSLDIIIIIILSGYNVIQRYGFLSRPDANRIPFIIMV